MTLSISDMLKDKTPMQYMDSKRINGEFIKTMMVVSPQDVANKYVAGSTYDRCGVSNNPDPLTRRMNQMQTTTKRGDFDGDIHRITPADNFSELHQLLMESKEVTDGGFTHEIRINEKYKVILSNTIVESDSVYGFDLNDNGLSMLVNEFGESVGRLFKTIVVEVFGDETIRGYDDENSVILFTHNLNKTLKFVTL